MDMSFGEMKLLYYFIKRRPHVICFLIFCICFAFFLLNTHNAKIAENYIPMKGEVCNLAEEYKYSGKNRELYYAFDIVWQINGINHTKHYEHWSQYESEGPIDIWVSPDGAQMRFTSSEEDYQTVFYQLIASVVTGILGCICRIFVKKRDARMRPEEIDNYQEGNLMIGGITVVIFLVMFIARGYVICTQCLNHAWVTTPYEITFMIFCGATTVVNLCWCFYTNKKIEEL